MKNNKKLIKDLEDDLVKKFCTNEKVDSFKKTMNDKLGELESKLALLDRRGNAIEVMEKTTKLLKELEEKIFALQREDVYLFYFSNYHSFDLIDNGIHY